MKHKTFDDLMRAVLAILPQASLGEDNEGQIVIYTNLQVTENNIIKEFVA